MLLTRTASKAVSLASYVPLSVGVGEALRLITTVGTAGGLRSITTRVAGLGSLQLPARSSCTTRRWWVPMVRAKPLKV